MATPAKTQPPKPAAQKAPVKPAAPAAKAPLKAPVKTAAPATPAPEEPAVELTPEELAAQAEREAAKAAKAEKSAARAEERNRFLSQKITLLVEGNPKRAGSAAATVWELYKDGMTVGEVLEAGASEVDVRYNLGHQFISLSE